MNHHPPEIVSPQILFITAAMIALAFLKAGAADKPTATPATSHTVPAFVTR